MPTPEKQADREVTTLRELLDASGPLPSADSVAILAQLACQLASTHEDGGVHGEVRPATILIRRQASHPEVIAEAQLAPPRRRAWNRSNAPEYRSPEQIRGEAIDPRTDVFALGLVFYEMLTGKLLRPGADPAPPSHENPNVPPELDRLVLAMLDKNRHRRLPNAGIAVRDLLRLNGQLGDRANARAHKTVAAARISSATAKRATPIAPPGTPGRLTSVLNFDSAGRAATIPPSGQRHSTPVLAFAPAPRRSGGAPSAGVAQSRPAASARWRAPIWIAIGVALLLMAISGWQYLLKLEGMRAETAVRSPASSASAEVGSSATREPEVPTPEAAPAASPPAPASAPPPEKTAAPPPPSRAASEPRAATPGPEIMPPVEAPTQKAGEGAPARVPRLAGKDSADKTAKVFFAVSPWGEIYIDGVARGTSPPLSVIELSPGAHRIEIRHAKAQPFLTFVNVKAGETRRIRHEFGLETLPK